MAFGSSKHCFKKIFLCLPPPGDGGPSFVLKQTFLKHENLYMMPRIQVTSGMPNFPENQETNLYVSQG
jgi:hypothetical protein